MRAPQPVSRPGTAPTRPLRLEAQDTALSRRQHRFESGRGRQINQSFSRFAHSISPNFSRIYRRRRRSTSVEEGTGYAPLNTGDVLEPCGGAGRRCAHRALWPRDGVRAAAGNGCLSPLRHSYRERAPISRNHLSRARRITGTKLYPFLPADGVFKKSKTEFAHELVRELTRSFPDSRVIVLDGSKVARQLPAEFKQSLGISVHLLRRSRRISLA